MKYLTGAVSAFAVEDTVIGLPVYAYSSKDKTWVEIDPDDGKEVVKEALLGEYRIVTEPPAGVPAYGVSSKN